MPSILFPLKHEHTKLVNLYIISTQDSHLTRYSETVAMNNTIFIYLSLGLTSPNSGWSIVIKMSDLF